MNIGLIGLGDIALKAYLPVLAFREDIMLHLYSSSQDKLRDAGKKYRIQNLHNSIDSLLQAGIRAAFVHVATEAHYEMVHRLLNNNIHVYVDKPLTYDLKSSKILIDLAKKKNLILKVGFNRRYAPAYQNLKDLKDCNMVLMQKNRKSLPGLVRNFIFDDFIHVIDTLLFLFPFKVDQMKVQGRKLGNKLYHVMVQLISKEGAVAIGIMNRDSGTTEEKVEIFTASEKRIAFDVSDVKILKDKNILKLGSNDWEPTLYKRGFYQITEDFIKAVQSGQQHDNLSQEILLTHTICEKIVEKLGEAKV